MIEWNKYFDHIYCIHYKPHVERYDQLCNEFKRINLIDNSSFSFWFTDKENKNNVLTVSRKHLEVYDDAIKNGYQKILVMENDIRFLKDINIVEEYLNCIPNHYDLILFDYVYGFWENELKRIFNLRNESKYINIGLDSNVWSCGCYALSKNMMNHIKINQLNNIMTGPDFYTTYKENSIDNENDKQLIRYVSYENIAIQKTYLNNLRIRMRGSDNTYKRYKIQGIDINNYNVRS